MAFLTSLDSLQQHLGLTYSSGDILELLDADPLIPGSSRPPAGAATTLDFRLKRYRSLHSGASQITFSDSLLAMLPISPCMLDSLPRFTKILDGLHCMLWAA